MLLSKLITKNLNLNLNTTIRNADKFNMKRLLVINNYFSFGKIVSIKLPDLGEGTKEATVKKWFKNEGEKIDEVEYINRYKINYNYSLCL